MPIDYTKVIKADNHQGLIWRTGGSATPTSLVCCFGGTNESGVTRGHFFGVLQPKLESKKTTSPLFTTLFKATHSFFMPVSAT